MPGVPDFVLGAFVPKNVTVVDTRNNNAFDGKISQGVGRDKELYFSSIGTPVMADVTFSAGSYTDQAGNVINFPEVKLETVLVTVDQQKKIITTEIQGRNGTVKEYIGLGDYEISIDGILTGTNGVYPVQKVLDLNSVLTAPVALDITSNYINRLGIYNVVVQSFSFPQEMGGYSQQTFSIKCLSDTPVALIIS
jgi:Domain of unknown function (DUF6046)